MSVLYAVLRKRIKVEIGGNMKSQECLELLNLINDVMEKYDHNTAVKICNNLTEWVNCCDDVSLYRLSCIVDRFKGDTFPVHADYDKDVQNEVLSLYITAAEHGDSNVTLLENGLHAHRGYEVLHHLAGSVYSEEIKCDILQYVADTMWCDAWIDEMQLMLDRIHQHKEFGYDLLSVFTPRHFTSTFHEVCYHLKDEERYRIKLDWLQDTNWRPYTAKTLVYLYMFHQGFDWSADIRPWLCSFATAEIMDNIGNEDLDVKSIVDKWRNVSPLLEYALTHLFDAEYATVTYAQYDELRDRYECDGDELAYSLVRKVDVPDAVMFQNAYYHNQVDGPKAEDNNNSILLSMAGNKYDDVKKLLPDCWPDFDERTLRHTIANALSMLS